MPCGASRFKDGYNVAGGSSNLFSRFIIWARDTGYDRVVSWSDNCWTDGNIYNVLKFNLSTVYAPDYGYWSEEKKRYLSKQSQRKSATGCPKDIKEHEWANERGLYRIWDCGKKKWEYKL